jgi:D-tyrosyl-tRNA(Tyr) deacylase
MICVLQRVSSARVRVGERTTGAISQGLLALVAVVPDDGQADVRWIADRLRHLRVFADEEGRMNLSVSDVGGSLLLVSQFTLAADTRRGRRPSFTGAAPPEQGERMFAALVEELRDAPVPVQTGEFGATMQVELVNDGPVTLIVDSARRRSGGAR